MPRTQRIDDIEKYVFEHKRVELDHLCEVFDVSKNTIRRDIDELCRRGNVKKVYGGICLVEKEDLLPFNERTIRAREAKKRIAAAAASLVEDGDIIFIDSGTTVRHMVEYVADRSRLTILTSSIDVVASALPHGNLNVICLSGALNRTTLSFVGTMAVKSLEQFNINKAFMASTGITIEKGATNFLAEEFEIKGAAMRQSQKSYLLVDKMKLGVVSMRTYAELKDFDAIVSDAPLPDEYGDYMARFGRSVIIAADNAAG